MVKVDQDKCIGCGLCVGLCPNTFRIGVSHKSEVKNNKTTECAKQASAQCPVGAISVK